MIKDLKYGEKIHKISDKDKEASVIVHGSTTEYNLKFDRRDGLSWQQERIIWIGFYKNLKNKQCLIRLLPADIVNCVVEF